MKSWLRIGSTTILAGAMALLLARGSHAAPKESTEDVFKAKCQMCHGPDGKGFPAIKTPDFTDPKFQAKFTDKEFLDIIKNGKKDTMMKGWAGKIDDSQMEALVKYVRSLGKKK